MNTVKKIISLSLAVVLLFGCMTTLISCGDKTGAKISNEETKLVLSTSELDGVFNPFYSSSGPDGSVVGMTQIGMLSADKDGKVAYGPGEACVVLDYETESIKEGDKVVKTVYRFVLKNDIKFSNGSPLTMKDVLFNLYVYLDPAYYGSSTIYSTDIVGLDEYRTQTKNEAAQENFNEIYEKKASDRILRFLECVEIVFEDNEWTSLTDDQFKTALAEVAADMGDSLYDTVVSDYELAKKYFKDELTTDYNYAKGTAEDISFTDKNGNEVTLKTDTEAFLYNEGFIVWDEKEKVFDPKLGAAAGKWSQEEAINAIFNEFIPNRVDEVVGGGWVTSYELRTRFALLEKQAHFESMGEGEKINSISGIKFANHKTSYKVGNTVYEVPTYNEDGSVKSGNEVLEITINDVDPKAIWNFGFTVAPMYYYSDPEVYKDFDYTTNFGVKFGSIDFQDNFVKNPDRIGVPVGAGPYKATTRSGDSANVEAGTFWALNVVYFERNEHFMFPVKIKYVNYQVVATNLMLESLYSGDVHVVEPACQEENIKSIEARKEKGESFDYDDIRTNGYGYIGINAAEVPDINVRRAIMHAINTDLAVKYYLGYSEAIHRPMTKASWAYPTEKDAAGQYYKFDETGATSFALIEKAGYTDSGKKNKDGYPVYGNDDGLLKYTFTVAGDTTDHPAYMSLKIAAEILNKNGFDIEVKPDINALKKLNTGSLAVWAAAWGAGVDPDMYQVYHIDSTAGSTQNWGYGAIKANAGGMYDEELRIVKELSAIIESARETLNEDDRKKDYADALDLVMELAVELPTYQRSDLFVWNTEYIDSSSLTPVAERTPYNGPMSKLWEVSLNERN